MSFTVYRIIGNSLPPRHSPQNNFRSVEFIIRNEPRFECCERTWILNKISGKSEKDRIVALFEEHGEDYIDVPFDHEAHFNAFFDPTGLPTDQIERLAIDIFQKHPLLQEWITRHKSQQLVGVNQARNLALRLGRARSSWTLVLDGGVLFSRRRWDRFVDALSMSSTARIAIVPMRRVYDWEEARQLCAGEGGNEGAQRDEQSSDEEPQIAFHRDSDEVFDERLRYGHRNKAELLVRLGLPGPWTEWKASPWESLPPLPAPNRGNYVFAGSVIRLPADGLGKELSTERYANRFQGVARRALETDFQFAMSRRRLSESFALNLPKRIGSDSLERIRHFAAELLSEKDRFITEKSAPAPSGNIHDYYSVAPYWTREGVQVDGVLQTQEGDDDPSSARYDRHSLKRFPNRVYGLTIAGAVIGDDGTLGKAAELLRRWFLEESTRMTPTARFAQCVPGQGGVNDVGLVEFRHLALLPFAIRVLIERQALSQKDLAGIKRWYAAFLSDCESIGVLGKSLGRVNNIGTWASVLFCSSALFTENFGNAFFLAETASIRLGKQLGLFSSQPHECERSRPLHYSLFNLAAWAMMMRLADQCAIQLQHFVGAKGESMTEALSFCSDNRRRFSDYAENSVEHDRWIELLRRVLSPNATGEVAVVKNADLGLPPILFL